MFPEKGKTGWIKKIVFRFFLCLLMVRSEELPLETETTVECVVLAKV